MIADLYANTVNGNQFGIDVTDGKVKDVTALNIWDCWETKSWALKLCVDSVITILKVDQIIMSKPSGGPDFDKGQQMAKRPDGY